MCVVSGQYVCVSGQYVCVSGQYVCCECPVCVL